MPDFAVLDDNKSDYVILFLETFRRPHLTIPCYSTFVNEKTTMRLKYLNFNL